MTRQTDRPCKKIFVTGTDTDTGKTILSLTLMKTLFNDGHTPCYVKPLQTGCQSPSDPASDAGFIYKHIEELHGKDPSEATIYCFAPAKAPLFAAEQVNKAVSLPYIDKMIQKKATGHSHMVIEGAGGLLVPLTQTHTMIDLIKQTRAEVAVAARAGLGTINHTLMTINCLRQNNIHTFSVYFVETSPDIPWDMIEENMRAIALFAGISVKKVIRYNPDFQA